jgi:hypothetical protein
MNKFVYHVVTEKPMTLNQIIIFDNDHHSGMFNRVYERENIVKDIYANLNKYENQTFDHHLKVAIRELAMEEVRKKDFPNYPSRLSSLYVCESLDDSMKWYNYFKKINRPTFGIVKLEILEGKIFSGDANNCFDGTINKRQNIELARHYWSNLPNKKQLPVLKETIVDGKLKVIKIMKKEGESK